MDPLPSYRSPLATEPPPQIVIDAPLAEWLVQGRVVIQYRTEIINCLPAGSHKVLIELVNANHQPLRPTDPARDGTFP